MADGLVSANFGDLRSIAGGLHSVMDQHEQSLDEQLRETLRSKDFWEGQNNDDAHAGVMRDRKIADHDIHRGRQQGRAAGDSADGYQDCVTQCSAYFS